MNPFEMVVIIVLVAVVGSIANNLIRGRDEKRERGESTAEADELREQILSLEDRIQVLERIVTDTGGRDELRRQFRDLER